MNLTRYFNSQKINEIFIKTYIFILEKHIMFLREDAPHLEGAIVVDDTGTGNKVALVRGTRIRVIRY